jgi:hypothetical protein
MIIPVLFLNESARIDKATRDELYDGLISLQRTASYVCWAAIIVGVFLIAVAGIGIAVLYYEVGAHSFLCICGPDACVSVRVHTALSASSDARTPHSCDDRQSRRPAHQLSGVHGGNDDSE